MNDWDDDEEVTQSADKHEGNCLHIFSISLFQKSPSLPSLRWAKKNHQLSFQSNEHILVESP